VAFNWVQRLGDSQMGRGGGSSQCLTGWITRQSQGRCPLRAELRSLSQRGRGVARECSGILISRSSVENFGDDDAPVILGLAFSEPSASGIIRSHTGA
jgi:hypothetical protein